MVFFERACGVNFLKHGDAVNFSRVVGADLPSPLARLCLEVSIRLKVL